MKYARPTCISLGADFPIIKSAKQNAFIFDLVRKTPGITSRGVWLGLERKDDDKFYWFDDTPVRGNYHNWNEGEPNNAGRYGEDCAHMEHYGKWNDNSCSQAADVICQK